MRITWMLTVILMWVPTYGWAVSCEDLKTPEKINEFIQKSKESNPLIRKNLSVYLEISPCEGQECSGSQLQQRIKKIEHVHLIKQTSDRRIFFIRGIHAPQCVVNHSGKDYLCSSCDTTSNNECRSFLQSEPSTHITGTNIDTTDFDVLNDSHHTSTCTALEKTPEFLKITTTRNSGTSPYDMIVTYYDTQKSTPVIMSFYAKEVMRKIYRFFPQYYIQLDGQWLSSIVRVRTTQGDEKQYLFETQIQILKDAKDQHRIYLNPSKDPDLKKISIDMLFSTH